MGGRCKELFAGPELELLLRCQYPANNRPLVDQYRIHDAESRFLLASHEGGSRELCALSGAAMSGPVDSVTRKASSSVDAVVRTGYYARFSEGVAKAIEHLQTTAVYKQVAIRAEPYVAPTWEKICTSDAYAYLVDKFTPFKEE